jgi:hypothetical protein
LGGLETVARGRNAPLTSSDANQNISRNGRYITGFDSQGHPYLLTAIALVPLDLLLE